MIAIPASDPGFLGAAPDGEPAHMAHLMLRAASRDVARIERQLASMGELTALHQITGEYDLVAVIRAPQAEALTEAVARVRALDGVREVMASVLSPMEPRARSLAAE